VSGAVTVYGRFAAPSIKQKWVELSRGRKDRDGRSQDELDVGEVVRPSYSI